MSTTTRKVAHAGGPVEIPVRLWTFNGHKLMTHRSPDAYGVIQPGEWRVSEETTGYGIPSTWGQTEHEAEAKACHVLAAKGDQMPKLLASLPVLNSPCRHEELDMDGVCKSCGLGGAPSRL